MPKTTLPEEIAAATTPEVTTPAEGATPIKSNELEEQNARLRNQVSAQDKALAELKQQLNRFQTGIASAIGGPEPKQELTIDEIQKQIAELRSKNEQSQKELEKSAYIDGLELSEARKKELKRRISISDEWQTAIERENAMLDRLIEEEIKTKVATDVRPTAQGVNVIKDRPTANDILANPQLYKKQAGI